MHRLTARRGVSQNNFILNLSHKADNSIQCRRKSYSSVSPRPDISIPHSPLPARNMGVNMDSVAQRVTERMIERQAKVRDKWHRTPSLRGEEMRLKKTIKVAEKRIGPSLERQRYESAPEPPEEEGQTSYVMSFKPGTFIETRRNEVASHGIVIGETHQDFRWRVICIMSNGENWNPLREDIMFSIPSMVPADLAERCGMDPLATTPHELNARIECLRRLQKIERSVEESHNLIRTRTADIYDSLAHSDPQKWKTVTVTEMARLLYKNPKVINIFTTHKFLMSDSLHFMADHSYQTTQLFHVRPWSEVERIETIHSWSRLKEGPLHSFALKVRPLIEKNQRIHEESQGEVPTCTRTDVVWNEEDKAIIDFLLLSSTPRRTTQSDPYSFGQSTIVKRILPSCPQVDSEAVQRLLAGIGLLPPWQDLASFELDVNFFRGRSADSLSHPTTDSLVQQITKSLSSPSKSPLGSNDLHTRDPMESVRHDFGDMPVYVIDDPSAQELDDGISVERIPSEPGNLWLHVHIADPGSVLPPTHILAERAREQGETQYFIHRSWPLLPSALTYHPEFGLSLGSQAKHGRPGRTLTFSAKLGSRGTILDYKVRAGLVRNVNILGYDATAAALGLPQISASYPFGGEATQAIPIELTPSQRQDLLDIKRIGDQQVKNRYDRNIFNITSPKINLSLTSKLPATENPLSSPVHYRGSSGLNYSIICEDETGTRAMVGEAMKIACRVASLFCNDHGSPAVRRVSTAPQINNEALQAVLDMRTPNGYVDYKDTIGHMLALGSSSFSLHPGAHFVLGVEEGEGYVRVTSPLRRYSDLVMHWQLQEILLRDRPKFSQSYMENYLISLDSSSKQNVAMNKRHQLFWALKYLKWWMERKARGEIGDIRDPLDNLEAYAISKNKLNTFSRKYEIQTIIPKLALRATLVDLDYTTQIPFGTKIPVKIADLMFGAAPCLKVKLR